MTVLNPAGYFTRVANIDFLNIQDSISHSASTENGRMAYGWAFLNPIRKVYYNLTITVISVLVACAIGVVELLQVITTELNVSRAFWDWLTGLDFETMGFVIIVMFLSWLVPVAIWKYRRIDEIYKLKLSSQGNRSAFLLSDNNLEHAIRIIQTTFSLTIH